MNDNDEYENDSYDENNLNNKDILMNRNDAHRIPSSSSSLSWADTLDGKCTTPVRYQDYLIEIELGQIQPTKGKKSILRQIRGKSFKQWKVCTAYDKKKECPNGKECEKYTCFT